MFRRRIRRIVRAPFSRNPREGHAQPETRPVPAGARGAQDIVDAARVRAQQEAVDWAESVIRSAQQRASDFVSEAEERVEQVVARSSQLTRAYLREVFILLDLGLAHEERTEDRRWAEPPAVRDTTPRRGSASEHSAEVQGRPNLGIVPMANEGT
jgi:hypothetical protein